MVSYSSSGLRATAMWLVRLWIGVARPSARGRKRFRVGPSSTVISATRISSATRSWLFSAFGGRRLDQLADVVSGAARGELEQGAGLVDVQAADLVGDEPRLAGRDADVAGAGPDDDRDRFFRTGFFRGAFLASGGFFLEVSFLAGAFFGAAFLASFFAAFFAAGFFRSFFALCFFRSRFFWLFFRHFFAVFLIRVLVGHRYSDPLPVPEWARKVRVGANSPSLWPTIDSEMKTGTCLRPSWTAIV